jgi:pimeloyl-ACP methyl ester carboxylesterase
VDKYPAFQKYFRTSQPPLLAVWGKNEPAFIPPGAEAYRRDIPWAEVHFLDTGHFALETHGTWARHHVGTVRDHRLSPCTFAGCCRAGVAIV